MMIRYSLADTNSSTSQSLRWKNPQLSRYLSMRAMRSERDISNNVLSFLLDPATNRLEDDIRREEGVARICKVPFSSHPRRTRSAEGRKISGARESDYEAR